MIYFDHNATSPLCDLGRDAWLEASERFYANPSSRHRLGQRADGALEGARESLAEALGCSPLDLIWTSGATESANAVFIHAFQVLEPEAEVWISQVEHPCVHEAAERYFKNRVRLIPVTREGVVDLDWLADAIKGRRNPGLVAVMAANNVTGVVQPWEWIRSWCEDRGILFFCDGAQWMGRRSAAGFGGCSFFSGCLHKNGGPRGIGFLKCPNKGRFYGAIVGGPQLEGRRAGTENLPGAIALAKVLAHFEKRIADGETEARQRHKQAFESGLVAKLPGSVVLGSNVNRLWNSCAVALPNPNCNGQWTVKLDRAGFAVSAGSACAAGSEKPSDVLTAMGLEGDVVTNVVRISAGWETSPHDWKALLQAIETVYAAMAG